MEQMRRLAHFDLRTSLTLCPSLHSVTQTRSSSPTAQLNDAL